MTKRRFGERECEEGHSKARTSFRGRAAAETGRRPCGNLSRASCVVTVMRFSGVVTAFALVLAALAWGIGPAHQASACSGPSTIQQMASSPEVFAGRITAVEEDPALSDNVYRSFRLQIDVEIGIRGTSSGERLQVIAKVPGPVPVMCPQFDRTETFLGKFVVAGLYVGDGPAEFYRWGVAYMGMDPGSADYAEALRAARIATGGAPDLPALALTPAAARCGSPVSVAGSKFKPGQPVLLSYPADPDESGAFIHPTVVADGSGRFVFSFRLAPGWCPLDWYVEAYEWRDDGQIGGWPLAMAPIRATAAAAPLPPDAGNSEVRERGRQPELAAAAIAVGIGAAVVAVRRRRAG